VKTTIPGNRPYTQTGKGPRGPTKWGRRLSSGAVGGVLWLMPQHPDGVKAGERRLRRRVP